LLRSNRELDQFTYIASHDLQEPLRKIMTFTERFQNKYQSTVPEEGKIFLDKVVNASWRMSRLIDELLRFSRMTRGGQKFSDTDLNEVVKDVMSDLEVLLTQKKAKVNIDRLPVIRAIPVQMTQLFSNLLSNALKFTAADKSPVIDIHCEKISGSALPENILLRKDRDYFRITVEDNGIGFNQKYAEKVFIIFQRIHDKNIFSGNGIGLAICRKIVHNHEGEIFATAVENKGATFTVLLPEGG
jgi:two-component system CheB/CheR fusion protein